MQVLVTGATGQLGRPTTIALRNAGHEVRAMSRKPGSGRTVADLLTGAGLAEAFAGVDTVVHLATTNGRADVRMAEHLVAAARQAGVAHLVLISIVDVDRIPLRFYRDRRRIEQIVEGSGVPYTLLRATQFHSLVVGLFRAQRFLPALVVPAIRVQPIAVPEVATRLTELASQPPQGRVADIGGPEQRPVRDFARTWQKSVGRRRPIMPLRLPGRLFAAYDAGAGLVPGPAYGRQTFDDYLGDQTGT